MTGKTVFLTVGTTKFDLLIQTLTQTDVLRSLKDKGYLNLIIQKGNGLKVPNTKNIKEIGINLTYYDYKHSILEDIRKADLVISHAGAGTCLEVLSEGKPLLVVVNEDLMSNHQQELADQLFLDQQVVACIPSTLNSTIQQMDLTKLKKMELNQSNSFANFLNDFMGFSTKLA